VEPPDTPVFVASVVVGAAAALLIFWHADRHGSRHPTAWGIAAFFAAVFVVPFYFVRHALRTRR
jgi:hypothetical protein